MLKFIIMVFILAFSWVAWAASPIPKNLSTSDRQVALEILGFGSSAKLLSSPYPLGGYSGVEVGVSSEYIPLADISTLGSKTSQRGDYNYFNLVFGKGLYYNIDVMLQFTPAPQEESVSAFGGQLRWSFYEATFMPAALSLVVHGSGANFSNEISAQTSGVDLIASVNMRDVSLFFGGGQARSVGSFIGGVDGITDSGQTETEDIRSEHTVFGISIKMSKVFLALQVDRYVQSTYAGKLGIRF